MAEHEVKFTLPLYKSSSLIHWLGRRCLPDGEHPQGIVSSVYYDTIDWSFLQEKINSDYLKTKYRLRWYQEYDSLRYSPKSYFEKKDKIGSSRRKQRAVLAMDNAVKDATHLNDRYFVELPTAVFSDDMLPIRAILPVFQISYTRYRFVDPLSGARLAVDYDIHVPRTNPTMVHGGKRTVLKSAVFEFKSDRLELPDWLHGVTLFGCRKAAFSKYSNCYEHITGFSV